MIGIHSRSGERGRRKVGAGKNGKGRERKKGDKGRLSMPR